MAAGEQLEKMRTTLLALFLCMQASIALSQVFDEKAPELIIENMDYSNFSKSFVFGGKAYAFFNTLIGDTIIFNGNSLRDDFICNDTIWIKHGVKKPIEGKHYKVKRHYKGIDDDIYSPNEFIYNRPWIIISAKEESTKSSFESDKSEILTIKDVQTGDIVNWRYRNGYNFSKNVNIQNVSRSRVYTSSLQRLKLYEQTGTSFNELHINKSLFTIETRDNGNSLHFTTTVLLSNNETYNIPFTKRHNKNSKTLYTEEIKNQRLDDLRNSGHFYLTLSKVEKPKNSQIRYGKVTAVSDKSVTEYSYSDNILSIIMVDKIDRIAFNLENKSGNSLKIEWDEASFIGIDNKASRVFHSGVKYSDKELSMPATIIPNGTSLDDVILPTNLTSYSGGDWHSSTLIPKRGMYDETKIGKIIKVLLPISVKGVINEYTFIFKVEWVWNNPELRNE